MNQRDDLEKRLEELAGEFDSKDSILGEVMMHVDTHPVPVRIEKGNLSIRRIVMSKFGKLAVAAVLIIGVFVFVNIMNQTSPIALADVLDKVQSAQAFFYRMTGTISGMNMPGTPEGQEIKMDIDILISNDYGMKMTNTMDFKGQMGTMEQVMYIIPDEKKIWSVMPDKKVYMEMEFTDDLLKEFKKQNNDPRDMIKQMLKYEYTELGESEIDGVKVQGFRTTDPSYSGIMAGSVDGGVDITLWVDSGTWLPVKCDLILQMDEKTTMTARLYDFQWNVDVKPEDFVPVIPDDYKTIPGGPMKLPEVTEKSAVDGFKLYLDITGSYPENLNLITVLKVASGEEHREKIAELLEPLMAKAETVEEKAMVSSQALQPLQSLGMFSMLLTQDEKEPVYYGKYVTPGNADQMLLRWKTEDGNYKAIFADLHIEEFTEDELRLLEANIEKETVEIK